MSLDVSLIEDGKEVYSANITHNLTTMADKAGIYEALWRPDEIGAEKAEDIIEYLKDGLAKMVSDPVYFEGFDSPNGWGTYENFVPWIINYLKACQENPNAVIDVCR